MGRSIRRDLLHLYRDLTFARPKGYEPFDVSSYNVFAWTAQHLAQRATTEEEQAEALRLKELALTKRKALLEEPLRKEEKTHDDTHH